MTHCDGCGRPYVNGECLLCDGDGNPWDGVKAVFERKRAFVVAQYERMIRQCLALADVSEDSATCDMWLNRAARLGDTVEEIG